MGESELNEKNGDWGVIGSGAICAKNVFNFNVYLGRQKT
jgi:hypothetical protein